MSRAPRTSDVPSTPAPGLLRSPHSLAAATTRFGLSSVTEMPQNCSYFHFYFSFGVVPSRVVTNLTSQQMHPGQTRSHSKGSRTTGTSSMDIWIPTSVAMALVTYSCRSQQLEGPQRAPLLPPPPHTAGKAMAAPAHCENTSPAEEELLSRQEGQGFTFAMDTVILLLKAQPLRGCSVPGLASVGEADVLLQCSRGYEL